MSYRNGLLYAARAWLVAGITGGWMLTSPGAQAGPVWAGVWAGLCAAKAASLLTRRYRHRAGVRGGVRARDRAAFQPHGPAWR